jgi:hypothetical protein
MIIHGINLGVGMQDLVGTVGDTITGHGIALGVTITGDGMQDLATVGIIGVTTIFGVLRTTEIIITQEITTLTTMVEEEIRNIEM